MASSSKDSPTEATATAGDDTPAAEGRDRWGITWADAVVALLYGTFGRAFSSLRVRDYRLLWFGGLVSNIGSLMQIVAVQHLVYLKTDSPIWLGLDAAATWLPMNLLLPFGGALADRLDKRRVIIVVNVSLASIAASLATLDYLNQLEVWHLIVASGL